MSIRGRSLILVFLLFGHTRIQYHRTRPECYSLPGIEPRNARGLGRPSNNNRLFGRSTSRRYPMEFHLLNRYHRCNRSPRKFGGQFSQVHNLQRESMLSDRTERNGHPGRNCGHGDFPNSRESFSPNHPYSNYRRGHVIADGHFHSFERNLRQHHFARVPRFQRLEL